MTTWEYRPGDFVALVSGASAVLLEVGTGEPVVGELLDVIAGEHTLEDVVEVLLGRGLRHLGAFAAARVEQGDIRVIVRGGFSATAPGEKVVVGSGLWVDHTFTGATQVTLAGAEAQGPELPIGLGAVLAASIRAGTPVQAEHELTPSPTSGQVAPTAAMVGPTRAEDLGLGAAAILDAPLAPASVAAEAASGHLEPSHVPENEGDAPVPEPHPDTVEPTGRSVPDEPESEQVPVERVAADNGWTSRLGVEGISPQDRPGAAPTPRVESPPSPGLLIESFPWAGIDGGARPDPVAFSAQPSVDAAGPADVGPRDLGGAAGYDPEALEMTVDRSRLIEHAAVSPNSVLVVAARCPSGHLSPAYADGCRVCHQPLPPQQPMEVARPQLGVLRLSSGDTVALDRGAVLGRNPRLPSGYSGEQPNLVRLSDPGKDISSQHLEVTLDYWHVLVTDLGSTNGTEVVLPGRPPIQLRPNDPMTIEPGTRVILAGVLDFVFEVAS